LDEFYRTVLNSGTVLTKALDVKRSDKFFVSGDDGSFDYYYTGRIDRNGDLLGLSVKSPSNERRQFGQVVVAIANTFHYPGVEEALASIELTKREAEVAGHVERSPSPQGKDRKPAFSLSTGPARVPAMAQNNEVLAVKWFRKAAEQGHAEAQFLLGMGYHWGDGRPGPW